tara:strand:- start:401 stop:607 length:207 start_codon:yes stop_codon:yes gene_type:complete
MAARKGGLFFGQSEVSVDYFLGAAAFFSSRKIDIMPIISTIFLGIHLIHATALGWSNRLRTLAFGVCE